MSDEVKEPFAFVIFGASGDLSRRKLIPALYHLATLGYLPPKYAVVGTARTEMTDDAFREFVRDAIQEHSKEEDSGASADAAAFLRLVCYQSGDTTKPQSITGLKARLDQLDKEFGLKGNRVFYLAVAPNLVQIIIKNLDAAGMLEQQE